MTTNNLPQTPTSTSLGRTSSLPLSRTWRRERIADNRVQDLAVDGYVEATRIAINTQNRLASVDGDIAIGEARVHGSVVLQHTETMGMADYGDAVDARLAQAGPVARQLIEESLTEASPRIKSITSDSIRNL